ncbi:flagellar M-ring protein FliF [Pseudomonas sp. ZM23]|uniref:Flagellar M-ring protein n=1 Tax=Pseudomonas triclosanedens TaxID=2961893 RepID=A0ABY6ZZ15_9PSED|nr:flagellar basal-body MS-ring/collar protein FliF [Pseudomonas triclosanedens]MCP8462739.1 flagellar M-ring protein FliF [Pseudomonas triclosanedens]MCP8468358.1 flagellar M-ring protein FliF [Pseudomonas triclosanedens]MCP8475117.1 flagellar M-ring protein FliF [Pseudomonas triclosanedens]WAI49925.1 flagellar basal-body MS-ring/collar protein FliF [Pseudomonas triclosanedens]
MLQNLKERLPLDKLKLDPRMGLLAIALGAALLAAAVVFYLWRDQGAYRPLYGAGEAYPAADVMQVLDAEAFDYRLHPQSGQVLVREEDLARARMLLAAKGVKVSLPAGYELFDKEEPLGTSHFLQDVRLKRSLEGELARTIMGLKGIEQARVHVAREDSNSFVVGRRDPAKASVLLQLAPGQRLGPEQVGAIVNLVAGSVPQLKPEDVSVVDQNGVLLSRGITGAGGPTQNWQAVDEYQRKAVSNVEEVLAPVLGLGNYRISVAADIDFSQKEETFQGYGESPRLRSESLRNETTLDQLALGVPGSLSNRPPEPPPQQQGQANQQNPAQPGNGKVANTDNKAATSTRNETTRQNDFDQTVTHIKYPAFALRQQSVAVVINAATAPEGGWTDKARADLEAMVKSAVGFNSQRGDLITVSVFPFAATPVEESTSRWWESSALQSLVRYTVLGLVALLFLLFGVRPAVRSLTQRAQPATAAALPHNANEYPLAVDAERRLALGSESVGGLNVLGELNPLSEIRLPAPGSGLEHQIEHLQMLAKNDPERVSEVIKHWIGRNDRHEPA